MKIRFVFPLIFILFISSVCNAKNIYSGQQLVYADDSVLTLIEELGNKTGTALLIDTAPVSVDELKLQLSKLDYSSLNDSEKSLYDQIYEYFEAKKWKLNWGGFIFSFNVNATPEFMYKSNKDIDWSFATDYTGGNKDGIVYGAASNFEGNQDTKKLISLPVYLGWGDYFFIETEPYFSKSFWGFSKAENFTNIVYDTHDMEFLFPSNAYFSAGKAFDKWGVNLYIAKEGLTIGRSRTGSVLYNSTFVTDCVCQLNLYSEKVKYNLDVAEIDNSKFIYLHYIDVSPFNWIRLGMLEGTLIQDSFELRYLNPIMIMHSFGSWIEYTTEEEKKNYEEAHVCAYFGFDFDINPCRNFHIYGAYAQNELQSFLELGNPVGNAMPDSYSAQLGCDFTINALNGCWKTSLEGVYSTPYSYVKQGADWSLYRYRKDMNAGIDKPVCSWIGSPFGPDAIAAQAKVQYSQGSKWNTGLEYLFVAHGQNSFGMFDDTWTDDQGNVWYKYYPSAAYLQGKLSAEDAAEIARNLLPSGIVSLTNRITLRGYYKLNDHFDFEGAFSYSFIFNNKNVKDAFAQGVEMELSGTWKLF